MTRPELILPSLSMPWGRRVEEELDAVQSALARQTQDSNSSGNVFAGQSDLIQSQISSIPSVAAIYRREVPPFSVTRAMNPSVTGYVYDSPVNTFNPPRPNRPYNYQVIAVMEASGVNLPFSRSLIRTNGVENMVLHENLQPGSQTMATYSISGSGSIGIGESVAVQFAIQASDAGTLDFNRASLWCVFTGSIL